jgi:protein-S-isoprenylcysteine O-methyltransferase Ste14
MELLTFNRISLAVFGAMIIAVVVVLPTLRLRCRTGLWPINRAQTQEPLQHFVGAGLALSIIAYGVWIACFALFDPEKLPVWRVPRWLIIAGWALALAGLALIALGQAHMGTSWRIGIERERTALVNRGVYRIIRNPIYSGWAVILLGVTLITPSPWTIMGWIWVMTMLGMQARLEERHLVHMHGEAYRAYARSAGRFVPGIGRWHD